MMYYEFYIENTAGAREHPSSDIEMIRLHMHVLETLYSKGYIRTLPVIQLSFLMST